MTEYCFQDSISLCLPLLMEFGHYFYDRDILYVPNSTEALITWGRRDMNGVITKPESQK